MQNEVNATLNLGGTLSLVVDAKSPKILFVNRLSIHMTLKTFLIEVSNFTVLFLFLFSQLKHLGEEAFYFILKNNYILASEI